MADDARVWRLPAAASPGCRHDALGDHEMAIFSINFQSQPTPGESKLGPVHKRLLARIRSWNPAAASHSGLHIERSCIRYLLTDDEANVDLITQALADLQDLDLVQLSIPDARLFKSELNEATLDIECARSAKETGLDPTVHRRAVEIALARRKAARG